MAAILVNSMNPKRTRRRFTAAFKAEVALAALTERRPLAELATRDQLSVEQISRWKTQLRQLAEQVFVEPGPAAATASDGEPLYAAIGRLQMENQLLKKNAAARCVAQQRVLVRASKGRCRPAARPWGWPAAVTTTRYGAKAPRIYCSCACSMRSLPTIISRACWACAPAYAWPAIRSMRSGYGVWCA